MTPDHLLLIAQQLGNISARLEAGEERDADRDKHFEQFTDAFHQHLEDEKKQNEKLLELHGFMADTLQRKEAFRKRMLGMFGIVGSGLAIALGVFSQVWPEQVRKLFPWIQ